MCMKSHCGLRTIADNIMNGVERKSILRDIILNHNSKSNVEAEMLSPSALAAITKYQPWCLKQ